MIINFMWFRRHNYFKQEHYGYELAIGDSLVQLYTRILAAQAAAGQDMSRPSPGCLRLGILSGYLVIKLMLLSYPQLLLSIC